MRPDTSPPQYLVCLGQAEVLRCFFGTVGCPREGVRIRPQAYARPFSPPLRASGTRRWRSVRARVNAVGSGTMKRRERRAPAAVAHPQLRCPGSHLRLEAGGGRTTQWRQAVATPPSSHTCALRLAAGTPPSGDKLSPPHSSHPCALRLATGAPPSGDKLSPPRSSHTCGLRLAAVAGSSCAAARSWGVSSGVPAGRGRRVKREARSLNSV